MHAPIEVCGRAVVGTYGSLITRPAVVCASASALQKALSRACPSRFEHMIAIR